MMLETREAPRNRLATFYTPMPATGRHRPQSICHGGILMLTTEVAPRNRLATLYTPEPPKDRFKRIHTLIWSYADNNHAWTNVCRRVQPFGRPCQHWLTNYNRQRSCNTSHVSRSQYLLLSTGSKGTATTSRRSTSSCLEGRSAILSCVPTRRT